MMKQNGKQGLKVSDIPSGTCKMSHVSGEEVAIFNVDGKFYAIQNKCTHQGGPLCQGSIWGETVSCPWHGSEFNVRTGEVLMGPATTPVKTYYVEVDDGTIMINTEPEA